MRSLLNLLKRTQQRGHVQEYEYTEETADVLFDPAPNEKTEEENTAEVSNDFGLEKEDSHSDIPKDFKFAQVMRAEKEAEEILESARAKADEVIKKANEEAEKRKIDAYNEGFQKGMEEGIEKGCQQAYDEIIQKERLESEKFLDNLKEILESTEKLKKEILDQYRDSLKDLSITIAEKVIQIGLRTSGEIIARIILASTEKLSAKEWVKIYVTKTDAERMIEAGVDIVKELSGLSGNIKIIPMNNEGQGTCIIEFPDEIIDASVSTQVENIRDIINNSVP